jgi:FkbM family methyltransferase
MGNNMRKVFIDCGANDGCSVRKFRKIMKDSDDYEIYSFECNPTLANSFDEKGVIFSSKAVSDKDGEVVFFSHTINDVAGTTFEKKGKMKNCGCNTPGTVVSFNVKTIRLSKFILDNFSREDHIILKLDVEGEEYRIVPDLIKTKAIDFVDDLWIEWHSKWIGEDDSIDRKLEDKIKSFGVNIDNTWDAAPFRRRHKR